MVTYSSLVDGQGNKLATQTIQSDVFNELYLKSAVGCQYS